MEERLFCNGRQDTSLVVVRFICRRGKIYNFTPSFMLYIITTGENSVTEVTTLDASPWIIIVIIDHFINRVIYSLLLQMSLSLHYLPTWKLVFPPLKIEPNRNEVQVTFSCFVKIYFFTKFRVSVPFHNDTTIRPLGTLCCLYWNGRRTGIRHLIFSCLVNSYFSSVLGERTVSKDH